MNRTQQKPTKVLVPLDGSRFGEQAIGAVARFTGADRREVVLLQVVAPVNPAPLLSDDSVARRTLETHGRSGLRRTLFGSVAEAVVRRSPLPVLMVRATGA